MLAVRWQRKPGRRFVDGSSAARRGRRTTKHACGGVLWCVLLSVCPRAYLRNYTPSCLQQNLEPARSSSGGVAIRYVLPVYRWRHVSTWYVVAAQIVVLLRKIKRRRWWWWWYATQIKALFKVTGEARIWNCCRNSNWHTRGQHRTAASDIYDCSVLYFHYLFSSYSFVLGGRLSRLRY